MKFEESLLRFISQIEEEYNMHRVVVKIGVEPQLYNRIMLEWAQNSVRFNPSDFNEPNIYGVIVVPRSKKDEF